MGVKVVAKLAGKKLDSTVLDAKTRNDKDWRAKNLFGKWPVLETKEGVICESMAIAKYLAAGHASLLGSNDVERAQVDQWTNWALEVSATANRLVGCVLGTSPLEKAAFDGGLNDLKAAVRGMSISGDWLVGSKMTLADVMVAATLALPFQLVLDEGFRKPSGNVYTWFERVAKAKEFAAVFGRARIAAKGLKPQLKEAAEPKKKQAQPAAKKEKPAEEAAAPKKDINPLDALPPSPWNFFDFKTLMVNHKDKAGAGMKALKEQYDPEGYTFWFLHYEKYGKEGTILYQTENLMKGFLQRFDHFRKHCPARICILNDVPNLEIEGVWCFRGKEIPAEMHEHPQFEYYNHRKMDFNDPKDFKLIKEFWSAEQGGTANGMKIQSVAWHK